MLKKLRWEYPASSRVYEYTGSGMSANRPDVQKLLTSMRRKETRYLAMYDWSRLARNSLITSGVLEEIMRTETQLALHSFGRVLNLNDTNDYMMLIMSAIMNEGQWMIISRTVRDGMYKSVRSGRWPLRVPFGFKLKDGILIPVPEQFELLNHQFELASLYSYREASRILEEERMDVSPSTLHYTVNNPVYKGILIYGRTRMGVGYNDYAKFGEWPGIKRLKAEEPPIVIENAFVSHLDSALVDEVRKASEQRRNNRDCAGIRSSQKSLFPLSGFLQCGRCNKPFSRNKTSRLKSDGSSVHYDYVGCGTEGCPNKSLRRGYVEKRFVRTIELLIKQGSAFIRSMLHLFSEGIKAASGQQLFPFRKEVENHLRAKQRWETEFPDKIVTDPVISEGYNDTCAQLTKAESSMQKEVRLLGFADEIPKLEGVLIQWCRDFTCRWKAMSAVHQARFMRKFVFTIVVERREPFLRGIYMTFIPRHSSVPIPQAYKPSFFRLFW